MDSDFQLEMGNVVFKLRRAISLIERMSDGDIEARNSLEGMCRHVPYTGNVLYLPLDDLFLAFAEALAAKESES